jgi:hypothetical protein
MVATPNLTLTITPPGGTATDYTKYLAWSGSNQQMGITQNFGRQGDTALFPLADDWSGQANPTFWVGAESQIKLFDNIANTTLFAGVVTNPVQQVVGSTLNNWNLQCTDYTIYADNAIVVGQFYGKTIDQIIVSLTQQANCGIKAASVASGGFVAPGPQLGSFILNYTTLSAAWRKLAQLASQVTPYGWYVDENLNLHFFDATTAISSGVTFTTNPTVGGSTTEGHIILDSQNAYEQDGTSIRNRILVQGATQTVKHGPVATTTATDTWASNGYQTSWPMRYTVTGSPILKINGVTTVVTIIQAGSTGTGAWKVQQNANGQWFLIASSAPSSGTTIRVWYDYQIPIVAVANDHPSQVKYNGPNGGVFSEYIYDTTITTAEMALARAQRQRTEYAFVAERFTFNTSEDWLGWVRAGETCVINSALYRDVENNVWGINDTFIVVSNNVNFVSQGGYRQAQITAVRL